MTRHITLWLTATLLQGCAYFAEGTSGWYVLDEDRRCWEYEEVAYQGAWWYRNENLRCGDYPDEPTYADDQGRCVGLSHDCGEQAPHDQPALFPCETSTYAGCCEVSAGGCL